VEAAWEAARAKAEATAAELRAISDVPARMAAFVELAARDGTDSTAQTGGDLGFFSRGDMVPEFAGPLFDTEGLKQGDIIGPVRTQFGWHVIMFDEARAPLADRLAAVEAALAAPDADFASVARELSDGPTAEQGGDIGWQVTERLDDLARMAVTVLDVGGHSQAIDGERGYTFYQKLEEATRPLDPDQAARIAQTAFADWYDEQRFQAEDEGRINIDDSVYSETEGVSLDG
jgi:parvulin-like peptidyl-prolyl isomerase